MTEHPTRAIWMDERPTGDNKQIGAAHVQARLEVGRSSVIDKWIYRPSRPVAVVSAVHAEVVGAGTADTMIGRELGRPDQRSINRLTDRLIDLPFTV